MEVLQFPVFQSTPSLAMEASVRSRLSGVLASEFEAIAEAILPKPLEGAQKCACAGFLRCSRRRVAKRCGLRWRLSTRIRTGCCATVRCITGPRSRGRRC